MPRNRLSWAKSSAATRHSARENAREECHSELVRWNQHCDATQNSANGGESEWEKAWYMRGLKPCHCKHHQKKQNCAGNARCLFGLGEHKQGAWAQAPPTLAAIQMPEDSKLRHPLQESQNIQPAAIRAANPVGLRNLGATCYVNSILQTLFMHRGFRRGIFECGYSPASISSSTATAANTNSMPLTVESNTQF